MIQISYSSNHQHNHLYQWIYGFLLYSLSYNLLLWLCYAQIVSDLVSGNAFKFASVSF